MPGQKTYSREEVAEILRTAAELETRRAASSADQASPDEDKPGLTADEIETIGQDAGLDLESVRKAIAEVKQPGRLLKSVDVTFNGPEIFVERIIRGNVDTDVADELFEELREREGSNQGRLLGMPGHGMGTSSVHRGNGARNGGTSASAAASRRKSVSFRERALRLFGSA